MTLRETQTVIFLKSNNGNVTGKQESRGGRQQGGVSSGANLRQTKKKEKQLIKKTIQDISTARVVLVFN